jgi:hypothetical protein
MRIRKHGINFSKYLTVGILASFLGWISASLLIDSFKFQASITLIFINIGIFLLKYLSYRKIRLLKKSFFIFMGISIVSTVLLTLSEIILINIAGFPAFIAVPLAEVFFFVLRFFFFYLTKIIQD